MFNFEVYYINLTLDNGIVEILRIESTSRLLAYIGAIAKIEREWPRAKANQIASFSVYIETARDDIWLEGLPKPMPQLDKFLPCAS